MESLSAPEEGGARGARPRFAEGHPAGPAAASPAAAPVSLSRALLALLVGTDGLFIVLHLVHLYSGVLQDLHFSIEVDWSYGEVFQMVKELWSFALLWALFVRTWRPVFGAWSLVLGYALLDDAVQIHEKGGGKMVEWLGYGPAFQLRAQDLGELTVTAVAGLGLALVVGGAYLLSGAEDRRNALHLAALCGLLFLCGVVLDMLHVVRAWPLLGLAEDGGEMLAMSLICWTAFRLYERTPPSPAASPAAG